jgi:hypothetical protein
MTFYAIKDTEDGDRNQLIYKSLLEGVARFGWSYTEYHDLRKINDMSWEEIDKIDAKEKTDIRYIWGKSYWLLNVNPDDYFVYINIPQYGDCCLVKITSKYLIVKSFFEKNINLELYNEKKQKKHVCNKICFIFAI